MSNPLLFVSVGTDHHRFDRLIDWVDEWVTLHPDRVGYVLQHGYSRPSELALNHAILAQSEVMAILRETPIIVTQGGPGSIVDARLAGRLPIAVPRHHSLREVVDDHQVAFCDVMEASGHCLVADTRDRLHELLELALQNPMGFSRDAPVIGATATAAELRRHMDSAVEAGPGWVQFARIREAMRRHPFPVHSPHDQEGVVGADGRVRAEGTFSDAVIAPPWRGARHGRHSEVRSRDA